MHLDLVAVFGVHLSHSASGHTLLSFFSDDFQKAVTAAIECGGDADTTAAIVGGIVGARVGKDGIPAELISAFGNGQEASDGWNRLGRLCHRLGRVHMPLVLQG